MVTMREMYDKELKTITSTETLCEALCEWIETHPGQLIVVKECFNYTTGEAHYKAEVVEHGEWTPPTEKERIMNAYKQGREDGYDDGCMDMLDDDLGEQEENYDEDADYSESDMDTPADVDVSDERDKAIAELREMMARASQKISEAFRAFGSDLRRASAEIALALREAQNIGDNEEP